MSEFCKHGTHESHYCGSCAKDAHDCLIDENEKLKAQLEKAESQKHDLIQYCMKHEQFQFMWAATILSIIFECDFRDSYNQAREYFKEKEQV